MLPCSATPSLSLNNNLQCVSDNLIQVILHGIVSPFPATRLYAPFKDSMTDKRIAELFLAAATRAGKPPWTGVDAAIARIKSASIH